jgi:hypothetical protein
MYININGVVCSDVWWINVTEGRIHRQVSGNMVMSHRVACKAGRGHFDQLSNCQFLNNISSVWTQLKSEEQAVIGFFFALHKCS